MKIAVFGYVKHPQMIDSLKSVLACIKARQLKPVLENELRDEALSSGLDVAHFLTFSSSEDLDGTFDLFLSIGGDGTFLRSVNYVRDSGIPVLGLNIGRLGFLANVQKEKFNQALDCLLNSQYAISKRSLILLESDLPSDETPGQQIALNEIALSRRNTTSMITIETWLNDEYLNAYWADGLIISTPTGSTGYSLSCGGPVISPETQALVLTPIAPHNLNARPLIIPDNVTVRLKVTGREPNYLVSLDANLITFANETSLTIKKAPFHINMIELQGEGFYKTLRKKLLWGEDKRNLQQ
ncbi:MAG: NAD kinase [Flavobacteriales bacterium CG_4_9_14_3_um_filter_40_17]|nr:MAG: NAD kinase [Flavobacteriales bacterium CG_4_9_14_3_um_filter_40_17]